ncbi:MAG: hypothetical protein GY844_28125 [Bradyrhizobium sp.]|nr:hypothetical protein [Bradyrhizobium sp.]
MCARHVIAVITVILVGVGLKLTYLPASTVGANSLSVRSAGLDRVQLHQAAGQLPVQKFEDMTFVFSSND